MCYKQANLDSSDCEIIIEEGDPISIRRRHLLFVWVDISKRRQYYIPHNLALEKKNNIIVTKKIEVSLKGNICDTDTINNNFFFSILYVSKITLTIVYCSFILTKVSYYIYVNYKKER